MPSRMQFLMNTASWRGWHLNLASKDMNSNSEGKGPMEEHFPALCSDLGLLNIRASSSELKGIG